MRLFNFFRRTKRQPEKLYPNRYVVRVSISHPLIAGKITSVLVTIDAHSGSHARKQLKEQLTLTVGKVVRSSST